MRICFIGDSFVNGYGDRETLGWRGRVCVKAIADGQDLTSYDLGIRRDTSRDICIRWQTESEARLPEGDEHRLLFSFGANDCADDGTGQPRLALEHSLGAAANILVRAMNRAPAFMVGPAPVSDDPVIDSRILLLDSKLEDICAEIGVPYLSIFQFVRDCEPWQREAAKGDGTHPDREGYSALADYIYAQPAFRDWMGLSA